MRSDSTRHRSEGRFQIESSATRVSASFTDAEGKVQHCHGQLADISQHGLRASLDGRLDEGQRVHLKVEVAKHSIVIEREAVVRWQHPRDAATWWTGCELDEPLGATLIEQLASVHVLNRRRDPRYEVDKPVRVRAELSHVVHEARLVNYSKGGFCLIFDELVEFPHERLMMIVTGGDHDVVVPARVMWSRQMGESFGVGCAFSDMDGFVHVRGYAEPQAIQRRTVFKPQPAVSSWIALAMAITIALQASWLMRTQPQVAEAIRDGWANWVVTPLRERWQPADPDLPPANRERAG